jgi:hypothetical protein
VVGNICNASKHRNFADIRQLRCHIFLDVYLIKETPPPQSIDQARVDEATRPIESEQIGTANWEDARHWMSIYADLIEFKRGILARIRRDLSKLEPLAHRAAEADVEIIESQLDGYQKRLDLWYQRVWDLHGLRLDPAGRIIRYKDRKATLTGREFQLLRFLLDHPHRYFTVAQILDQAWAEPALIPEEVRSYVQRVRKIVMALEIPCDLVTQHGRGGYSLEFSG